MVTREGFGFVLHTLFRKSLDSIASSICYNAINVMSNDQWSEFLDVVYPEAKAKGFNRNTIKVWYGYGHSAINLFSIGLDLLSDEEYEVLNKYLFEEK